MLNTKTLLIVGALGLCCSFGALSHTNNCAGFSNAGKGLPFTIQQVQEKGMDYYGVNTFTNYTVGEGKATPYIYTQAGDPNDSQVDYFIQAGGDPNSYEVIVSYEHGVRLASVSSGASFSVVPITGASMKCSMDGGGSATGDNAYTLQITPKA